MTADDLYNEPYAQVVREFNRILGRARFVESKSQILCENLESSEDSPPPFSQAIEPRSSFG